MPKVLIISYSFPPSNAPAAQRPYYLSKYLSNFGLEPIVITSKHSVSSIGVSEDDRLKSVKSVLYTNEAATTAQVYNSIKSGTTWYRSLFRKLAQWVVRNFFIPDRAIVWKKHALQKAEEALAQEKIDYVFSTSPNVTNHVVALQIAKKHNIKWLADFRDFYALGSSNSSSLRQFFDKRLEKRIVTKADQLTFVSKSMKEAYASKYNCPNKCHIVHNGFELLPRSNANSSIIKSDEISIVYAGSFYNGIRSPESLLQGLSGLIDKTDFDLPISVYIAGNLVEKDLEKYAHLSATSKVKLLGMVSKQEVQDMLESCTFPWLIVGNKPSHYQTIPLKFFEYLAIGKPIIYSGPNKGETFNLIKDHGLGICITENQNLEELKAFMKTSESNADYSKLDFTWENQVNKMAEVIKLL